uniref:Uncharacterized protein n=1 Tax=Anguilla anguilla TaxID=7936 RepID=A0A0E9PLX6_ANGAN
MHSGQPNPVIQMIKVPCVVYYKNWFPVRQYRQGNLIFSRATGLLLFI